jgi:hypothetical protein
MSDIPAFPSPFRVDYQIATTDIRTLRELAMMQMSAAIRAKPDWHRKMHDADIVAKWTREAAEQGMTEAQIRYVLAELAHYASLRDERTGIEASAVDGVWQSDALIEEELRSRLRDAVRVLEDVPEAERDWHPGSDNQVLDLVHPSLFCRVRGVSQPEDAEWPQPGKKGTEYALSQKFQWLPTDVEVGQEGAAVFQSYINNVHPEVHRELEAVLPAFFERMLPLFENVLTDLRHPRQPRIEADAFSWYEGGAPAYPNMPKSEETAAIWEAFYEATAAYYDNRVPTPPDAPDFVAPKAPDDAQRVTLRGSRLQVIVKLANIHLTPERPEYAGGSWHVEGMMNEHIVSTGLYYWDSENITDSRLRFRAAVDEPSYEQNDNEGVLAVYGLSTEEDLNQEFGAAVTQSGRALAFPNILQHRVEPFRLADPTQPGHRKILAFFLIDPSLRIVSTADVPPQQPWAPTSTMTLEQAKEFRGQLMEERKFFVDAHSGDVFERMFSLCEH